MNRDYGASYRDLYRRHWWWRAREVSVLRQVETLCNRSGHETILDVGCGDGLLFDKLLPYGDVHGVEVCADLVSSDNPHRDKIHLGPFDESYPRERQFSLILMLDVLEHFPDPVAALNLVRRLLRPDGVAVIHVPAFRCLWTSHDELNHHFTRYTRHTLTEQLSAAQLAVTNSHYSFYWTCPVKWLMSWAQKLVPCRTAPPRIPARPLNALLYTACRLEQQLIQPWRPPFGSSLMAVARHAEAPSELSVGVGTNTSACRSDVCEV